MLWIVSGVLVNNAAGVEPPGHSPPCEVLGGQTTVWWMSRADIDARERELAELELRAPTPSPVKEGILFVTVDRLTYEAADGQYQTLIVTDTAGVEVLRKKFAPDSPDDRSRLTNLWRNTVAAPVEIVVPTPARVHVADTLLKTRCSWELGPPPIEGARRVWATLPTVGPQ